MAGIDFDNLFEQADALRDGGQVTEAIAAYLDIARLATDEHEMSYRARALHLAGVSAKAAIKNGSSSYYRDAIKYYLQAEAILLTLNDRKALGALYRDIAMTADDAEDYSSALPYFQKAIEQLSRSDAFGELAVTYDKLGVHHYKLGQFQEADNFIVKALNLFRQEPTSGFFRATTLLDSARIQFKLGQFDRALELATESLSWYEADHPGKNFAVRKAELNGLLAVIYVQLGKQKLSEKHYDIFQSLLKTLDPLVIVVIEKELKRLLA